MSESLRWQDTQAEQRLGEFMDENLYSKLVPSDGQQLSFERRTDRESQLKGIDVIIYINGKSIIVDEKASIYYSNAMIPTFAFEIDSIQRGHEYPVEGWFVNDELATQYYMLIWPNVKCVKDDKGRWVRKEVSEIRKSDFTIVEAMMIKKTDLRAVLGKHGYTRLRLIEYANRLRETYAGVNDQIEETLIPGIRVMLSGQLAERPINLVIKKEILLSIAKKVFLVSQDGYALIK